MFFPETENLLKRKNNITRGIAEIKSLEFRQLKEALEIQGSIVLINNKNYIKIDDVYGISFLVDLYYSFLDEVDKEINIHYWEDHGHRIDIYKLPYGVKIIDSHSVDKNSILLTIKEFKEQFTQILREISQLSFLIYYPLVKREDYFEQLEKMSILPLEWPINPVT